mmetsp:Transcript_118784/g.177548  ORF Transcript_118784/g.177548 Transcript_118784/m.177548 type:complete len:87 (-) Transcript_118784:97-357(-)
MLFAIEFKGQQIVFFTVQAAVGTGNVTGIEASAVGRGRVCAAGVGGVGRLVPEGRGGGEFLVGSSRHLLSVAAFAVIGDTATDTRR